MADVTIRKVRIKRSVEFTRPSNTTAYTAGDVVSNNATTTTKMHFQNFSRENSAGGVIVGARVDTDKESITPQIRIHLYSSDSATVAADNAATKELYADVAYKIGTIDMAAMTTPADTSGDASSRSEKIGFVLPFVCSTRSVYAVLEAIDGFTPASAQKFTVTLVAELD